MVIDEQSTVNQSNWNLFSASWSQWTDETPCSASCGGAIQTQRRICNYNGGTSTECPGLSTKTIQCNSQACREYRWKTDVSEILNNII